MYALVLAVPVNVSWANPTSEPPQASLGRSWTLLKVNQETTSTWAPYGHEGQVETALDKLFELRYERMTQNMLVHIVTGVTGRAFFIDKLQSNIHSLKFQLLSSCSWFDSGSHNGHWQLLQPLEFQRCYDRLPIPANEYTFMIMTGRPEGPSQPLLH